jgi:catechol 2,3-dioxygenase
MERSAGAATLGTAGITLLVLEARPEAAIEPRNAAGLYHTAFLMPSRKDLARWLVHAASHRVPLSGFADHLVSESVYLDDPEGNGIEVYADRDPSQWQWSEGSVKMASDELNIPDLLSLTNTRVADYAKAPDGLRVGHMHLRVGDLAEAERFYHGTVGLDPTRRRGGAAFLSSGRYHHHLGMNVWQSQGAGQRDDQTTGLAWFSLVMAKQDILAAQEERLRKGGAHVTALANGVEAVDPWGTRVRLIRV